MALGHAPRLLSIAQSGERKLTTAERRLVIRYLMATQPEITNGEMAQYFSCSEKTIRDDKNLFRSQKAKYLKDELARDMSLVIADIATDFEKQVTDIEIDKASAKKGSVAYLQHCQAILDMRLKMIAAFQSIGYLPKNLGAMTQTKFEYKAVVHKDGSMNTRSVSQFDDVQDAEIVKPAELPAPKEDVPVTKEMQDIIDADKAQMENKTA